MKKAEMLDILESIEHALKMDRAASDLQKRLWKKRYPND